MQFIKISIKKITFQNVRFSKQSKSLSQTDDLFYCHIKYVSYVQKRERDREKCWNKIIINTLFCTLLIFQTCLDKKSKNKKYKTMYGGGGALQ